MKKTNKSSSENSGAGSTASKLPVSKKSVLSQPVTAKLVTAQPQAVVADPLASKAVRAAVSLELVQPNANKVCVAGSFNGWRPESTPLQRTQNGRWVGDLSLPPGKHEYLFVVDGQWVPDPNAKENVRNPFGGTNSILSVSA